MKVVIAMSYDISLLNYQVTGKGKTIIFLHGWGQNLKFFQEITNLLSSTFTCLSIDLPGWGNSPINEFLSIDDYTDIIHDFVTAHNIDLYALIGHSWGGKIATNYCLKYPVKKLVLAASSNCKPRFSLVKKIKILTYKCLKKISRIKRLENKMKQVMKKYGSNDYKKVDGVMKKVFIHSINTYYDDDLCRINIPTLIYWGEKDQETPLYMAKRLYKEIINSKLKIVKNGDHFALIKCRYNFAVVVQNFLKEGN
jgi:pimeloyl-ACP methyl ester carboxylesterase